jgi:Beta-lactamase
MSGQPRSFPGRPNLRYLKLEARRRLSAGEFGTLHDAQLAIAREHRLSSWAALKEHITSQPEPDGPALRQIRWVVSRFRDADRPAWSPPTDQELREHFHESVLTRLPADDLPATLRGKRFRRDLEVIADRQLAARAVSGGMQIAATTEPEPPHRLTGLRVFPGKQAITDARIAAPSASTSGEVPAPAARVAGTAFAELGLVALALGGNARYGTPWTVANGWADLDRAEVLRTSHRFPVYGITVAITATAVLRLVADDLLSLDHPANDYLRTVRLADDAVTVRELPSRTNSARRKTSRSSCSKRHDFDPARRTLQLSPGSRSPRESQPDAPAAPSAPSGSSACTPQVSLATWVTRKFTATLASASALRLSTS